MTPIERSAFQDYLEKTERVKDKRTLFRGQPQDYPLLPSIARLKQHEEPEEAEKLEKLKKAEIKLIDEFKRRSQMFIKLENKNDWEWLVLGQHFGLKTRLLDWTSNPLTALWFACSKEDKTKEEDKTKHDPSPYVYVLKSDESLLVGLDKDESPFDILTTKILRPFLKNERIVAQAGLFTVHPCIKNEGFVPLQTNSDNKIQIEKISIAKDFRQAFLTLLSDFGISSRTLYPDLPGLCHHLNWKYGNEK